MTPNPERDTPAGTTRLTRARHWVAEFLEQPPNEMDTTIDEILASPRTGQPRRKLAIKGRRQGDIQWLLGITILLAGTGTVLACALADVSTARLWAVVGTHVAGTLMLSLETHDRKAYKKEVSQLGWAVHMTGTAVGIRYFMEG